MKKRQDFHLIYSIFFIIEVFFLAPANAGIDTHLYTEEFDGCQIRIQHSATPGAEQGVIDFRAYKDDGGVLERCSPPRKAVTHGLGKALSLFVKRTDLQEVESIFIGRLVNYRWIKDYLNKKAMQHKGGKMSAGVFHKMLMGSGVMKPFRKALQRHGYEVQLLSCEKLLHHEDGAIIDAMCWLVVKK